MTDDEFISSAGLLLDAVLDKTSLPIRLDEIDGRIHHLTGLINRAIGLELTDAKRDKAMSKSQDDLVREVQEIKTAVEDYTTDQGKKIEEAVAAAVAAKAAADDAAFDAAAKELDSIAKSLVVFSPSGQ